MFASGFVAHCFLLFFCLLLDDNRPPSSMQPYNMCSLVRFEHPQVLQYYSLSLSY